MKIILPILTVFLLLFVLSACWQKEGGRTERDALQEYVNELDAIEGNFTQSLENIIRSFPIMMYDEAALEDYIAQYGTDRALRVWVQTFRDYVDALIPLLETTKHQLDQLTPPPVAQEFHQRFDSYLSAQLAEARELDSPYLTLESGMIHAERMGELDDLHLGELDRLISDLRDAAR